MDEVLKVDLSVFLAAVLDAAGGEIRVPYDSVVNPEAKAIAIDFVDDGATIVLSLTEEIPNE